MIKNIFVALIISLLIQGCGLSERKSAQIQIQKWEQAIKDSIELALKIQQEKETAFRDSIISIEQDVAIGTILFNITEKEFNKLRNEFLDKCRLPNSEYYKGLTIFTYKIGEYGFNNMYGWFYNNALYNIRLEGSIVKYDDYDLIMPDQYKALTSLLKEKYGEPTVSYGLPKWTDLDKGYFRRCDIWDIGTKKIEVRVSCEGVNYFLNLEVFKPEVVEQIQVEKETKESESTKNAVDLL